MPVRSTRRTEEIRPPAQGEAERAMGILVGRQGEPRGQGPELGPGGGQHHAREAAAVGRHVELPVCSRVVGSQEAGARPAHRGEVGAAVAVEDPRLPGAVATLDARVPPRLSRGNEAPVDPQEEPQVQDLGEAEPPRITAQHGELVVERGDWRDAEGRSGVPEVGAEGLDPLVPPVAPGGRQAGPVGDQLAPHPQDGGYQGGAGPAPEPARGPGPNLEPDAALASVAALHFASHGWLWPTAFPPRRRFRGVSAAGSYLTMSWRSFS